MKTKHAAISESGRFDRIMGEMEAAERDLPPNEYEGLLRDVISLAQNKLLVKKFNAEAQP